jgi:DHA2 family multidrug resistance protein
VLQGVALSLLFIPLMSLAVSRISPEKMGNATSIFNLMRNIGGSVGIALMTTFLARRAQVHQNHRVANITAGCLQTNRLMQGLRAIFLRARHRGGYGIAQGVGGTLRNGTAARCHAGILWKRSG